MGNARGRPTNARARTRRRRAGPEYGPDLKGFGSRQPPEIVARSIVEPSFDISHGFEGSAIQLKDGKWIDGRIISDGDPVVITSTGGFTQKVPKKQIASRKDMDRSLMLATPLFPTANPCFPRNSGVQMEVSGASRSEYRANFFL